MTESEAQDATPVTKRRTLGANGPAATERRLLWSLGLAALGPFLGFPGYYPLPMAFIEIFREGSHVQGIGLVWCVLLYVIYVFLLWGLLTIAARVALRRAA